MLFSLRLLCRGVDGIGIGRAPRLRDPGRRDLGLAIRAAKLAIRI